MKTENQNRPDTYPLEIDRLETLTTASEGHPERGRCRRCGAPVRGRRRDYCSNACRMRDRRAAQAKRVDSLLDSLQASLTALREELAVRS